EVRVPRVHSLCLRRPPRCYTLFPYTTLFRSQIGRIAHAGGQDEGGDRLDHGHGGVAVLPVGVKFDRALQHDMQEIRYLALPDQRSEEHTSELQSRENRVCRLLLEKNNKYNEP